jgi:hypothetical protein
MLNYILQTLLNIKYVFWFYPQLSSETFLILRRSERDIIINVINSNPLFLSDFNETCIFSTGFSKKNSNIKFHENPSSGSQVPSGQADMTKQEKSLFVILWTRLKALKIYG